MYYALLILQTIIFPGLIFTAVVGLVTSWIDRKVTARVQMRVGPPFLQPFYDIMKYCIKETCVPARACGTLFLLAPLLGLGAVTIASTILWGTLLFEQAFVGDLIVVIYLLTIPALAVVLGAFSSENPIASLGGSREMKLILGYELPFVLSLCVPIIEARSIRIQALAASPVAFTSLSGTLALLVAVICMQAKLTVVPFDAPEAETELAGGAYIEYSGPPLGIFKLTRAMMLFTMPTFLIAAFCGGTAPGGLTGILLWILKYVALIVVIVLIKNTAPRVRIDHAVKFFWKRLSVVALIAVILAFLGL